MFQNCRCCLGPGEARALNISVSKAAALTTSWSLSFVSYTVRQRDHYERVREASRGREDPGSPENCGH